MAVDSHKTRYEHVNTSLFSERLWDFTVYVTYYDHCMPSHHLQWLDKPMAYNSVLEMLFILAEVKPGHYQPLPSWLHSDSLHKQESLKATTCHTV